MQEDQILTFYGSSLKVQCDEAGGDSISGNGGRSVCVALSIQVGHFKVSGEQVWTSIGLPPEQASLCPS